MLLVFVDKISERLIYTFDFIFKNRTIDYRITNDLKSFEKFQGDKFVYAENEFENFLKIIPSTLLFDEAIFKYDISKSKFYTEECLAVDKITDPFASVFYILTRYEEYIVKQKDEHDRFVAKNSLLKKYDWLDKLICERISEDTIAFLEFHFQHKISRTKIPFQSIPTFDIDNTFAFKWKEGLRGKLAKYKDVLKKDTVRIAARLKFESEEQEDPYDAYDLIKECANSNFKIKIFWLVGDKSKYDTNISINDNRHQALIKEMSHFGEIGLHPSYQSNESIYALVKEQEILSFILKRKLTASRQHFLKLKLPKTYQTLLELGFTDDYTMGFSDEVGFRAGTAQAHNFFDLNKNEKTNLVIHPFSYMDGTLNHYLKLSPESAKARIRVLYEEVKKYGGDFIFIWHNETMTDFGGWKGWKSVFDFTLNLRNEI